MPRPGKRRRLTVVDLRDSDAMFVALMRLLATLQARHPEHKADLNVAERILDTVQDRNRQRIELAEDAADFEEPAPSIKEVRDRLLLGDKTNEEIADLAAQAERA